MTKNEIYFTSISFLFTDLNSPSLKTLADALFTSASDLCLNTSS